MEGEQKNLSQLCKEFDLQKELKVISNLKLQINKKFKDISQDALQWLEELKELQKSKGNEVRSKQDALLPQTPTMKRKLRKRKLPLVDDPEKENLAVFTRSRRAASQAANLKFHQQLNVPKKLRRPSSPKAEVKPKPDLKKEIKAKERQKKGVKRLRLQVEQGSDSEDNDVPLGVRVVNASVNSTTTNKVCPHKDDAQALLHIIDNSLDTQTTSTSPEKNAIRKPRTKKQKIGSPVIGNAAAKPGAAESDITDTETTIADAVKTRLKKNTKDPVDIESSQPKCPPQADVHEQHVSINVPIVAFKEERLSTVVEVCSTPGNEVVTKLCEVKLKRLSAKLRSCVLVTPKGTLINVDDDEDADDEQEEFEQDVQVLQSPKSKRLLDMPSTSSATAGRNVELHALTPHLKGIVKERVEAVEKSLKKEERAVSRLQESKQKTVDVQDQVHDSSDMYESAECSEDEADLSPSKFAPISGVYTSTVAKTLPKQRTSRRLKGHKRSPSSKLPVPQSGRSRVLTGLKTFIKPSARDVAASTAVEEEKKRRAEEAQRNLGRVQDATKKKEEQLRLKKEQKKKENEEKRARAMLAKEVLAKEQEDAARAEKEKEERKAAQLRLREEKELAEKEARKEQKKQKLAEREQRRKEEEAARHAKVVAAAQEQSRRDEERKADASKGNWAAAQTTKLNLTKTGVIPIAKVAVVSNKQTHLNETFEIQNKPKTAAQPKVIAATASSNNYAMTPSRDELPPQPSKNANDYGIDEVNEDDPSDDDEKPKKKIPSWARNMRANVSLDCADFVSIGIRNNLFGTRVFKPSAQELFGVNARQVTRRSSAIWNTPPNVHHVSFCSSFVE